MTVTGQPIDGIHEQDDRTFILTDNKYLRRFLLRPVVVLLLCVALIPLRDARPPLTTVALWCTIFLLPLHVWVVAVVLARMRRPRPAAILTPEGVIDDCSLIGLGIGLIPWSEISAITTAYWGRDGFFNVSHDWFVVIVPRDLDALLSRSKPQIHLLRRCLRIVVRAPAGVCFPDFTLAARPTAVLAGIDAYIRTHVGHHAAHIEILAPDRDRLLRLHGQR